MTDNNGLKLTPIGSDYKSILPHNNIESIPKEMDAWVSYKNGRIFMEKIPLPKMLPQDVLIEVLWISICPSDIKKIDNPEPELDKTILGHEFAGRIISVGEEVDKDLIGQVIAVEEHYPCLNCDACAKQKFDQCEKEGFLGWYKSGNPEDWVRNGSFAEYVSIHYSCAKKIEGIEKLDFFPSLIEPFGNAAKMERIVREECKGIPDTIVLWGGCGLQGSYMSSYFSRKGVRNIILLDKNDASIEYMKKQLEDFRSRFYLLNIKDHLQLKQLKKKLGQQDGFINIDLTGNHDIQKMILKYAYPSGKIFFFGLPGKYIKSVIPGTTINLYQFLTGRAGIDRINIGNITGVRVMGRDNISWEKTIEALKNDNILRRFILKPLVLAGSNKNLGQLIDYTRKMGSRFNQAPYGLRPAKFGVVSEKILNHNVKE